MTTRVSDGENNSFDNNNSSSDNVQDLSHI